MRLGMIRWFRSITAATTTSAVRIRAGTSLAWSPIVSVSAANRTAVTPAITHRRRTDGREPVGTLYVATDDTQLEELRSGEYGDGELLDRAGVLEVEPALSPTVAGGLRLSGGRRSDPSALTAAAAELARSAGAAVRTGVD